MKRFFFAFDSHGRNWEFSESSTIIQLAPKIHPASLQCFLLQERIPGDVGVFFIRFGDHMGVNIRRGVENKQKFISQIMTGKTPLRSCDDVDETALSFAEIKALCAGPISCSAIVFKLASGLIALMTPAVLFTCSVQNGIILLVLAFLVSPLGLPMLAVKLLGVCKA